MYFFKIFSAEKVYEIHMKFIITNCTSLKLNRGEDTVRWKFLYKISLTSYGICLRSFLILEIQIANMRFISGISNCFVFTWDFK